MISPIDLHPAVDGDLGSPSFLGFAMDATIEDTGSTIMADVGSGGTLMVDARPFNLEQFHFHAPSEHVIDGKHAACEIHFVFRTGEQYAAVGLLIVEGDPATGSLASIIEALGVVAAGNTTAVDLGVLTALERTPTIRYEGSLTTPPFTEGVVWLIEAHPMTASHEQIASLQSRYSGNNHTLQSREGATVVMG